MNRNPLPYNSDICIFNRKFLHVQEYLLLIMFDIKIRILDFNSTSKSLKNPSSNDDFVYFILQAKLCAAAALAYLASTTKDY